MFNTLPSTWMHIDLNSCFATIEQQANPFLRGKPIVVAPYTTSRSMILAPSIEAKQLGIKMGMRVSDAQQIYPRLIVLAPDPAKYRFVNQKLTTLLQEYSPHVSVRSIDEMVLNFENLPMLREKSMFEIGKEIKIRIKKEIGEWLTVSIGISTNPYLSKLAANLHKPDGLDEINKDNVLSIFSKLKLIDFPYIKERNAARLNRFKIYTSTEFFNASAQTLRFAFEGVTGEYWYLRIHGYSVDAVDWGRKTIGHSYHLPKFTSNKIELKKLLCKLVEKIGRRLRKNNLTARGVRIACHFAQGDGWNHGQTGTSVLYHSHDIFDSACHILNQMPPKRVKIFAVNVFHLTEDLYQQFTLFADESKKRRLTTALDKINNTWGEFSVIPGGMMGMEEKILDRISFGQVRDMTQVLVNEKI